MTERPKLTLEVPHFPPSVNKLYIKVRGGQMRLSDEARAFINAFTGHLMKNYLPAIMNFKAAIGTDPATVFSVIYEFYFPEDRVRNMTYGTGVKQAAKTPFAKMDVENLLKLVSDCLAKTIDIDDCRFFTVVANKNVTTKEPYIGITVTQEDLTTYGVTSVPTRLVGV